MIPAMKAQQGYERWCDDVTTRAKETCAMLAAKAFDLAAVDLRARFGDPGGWRWGRAHVAASDHRPFGFFPVIARLFNVDPPTPGDSFSVNVGHYIIRDEARPYANKHAASLRALYDLDDLERSRFMQSTGQSGNVLSPWYGNLAERWAKVEYVAIPTVRANVSAAHTLVLRPAR
jgi:penicillin amidase